MKNSFYILGLLIVFSSCDDFRKEVDFEDDQIPTSLVVNAFPAAQDSLNVSLTLSQGVLTPSSPFEKVLDADVKVYANSNLVEEVNGANNSSEYLFSSNFEENNFYQIEVEHPNFETISAETFVPNSATELSAIGTTVNNITTVDISFQDSPNSDFYRLVLLENENIIGWETKSEYFEIDPFEESTFYFEDGFFTDEGFKNGTANIQIELIFFQNNNNIDVALIACSEEYFNYFKSRFAWEESDGVGLFTEPVQIFSNVENGLGIFAGYSSNRVDVEF